jgi:hypothetical protein
VDDESRLDRVTQQAEDAERERRRTPSRDGVVIPSEPES